MSSDAECVPNGCASASARPSLRKSSLNGAANWLDYIDAPTADAWCAIADAKERVAALRRRTLTESETRQED